MSDIKSVVSFFAGLVLFVLLVVLALGRIKLPSKETKNQLTPAPTVVAAITAKPTGAPFFSFLQSLFKNKKLTPTPTKQLFFGKEAIEISPTIILTVEDKNAGSSANYFADRQVVIIPDTGAPTLLIPLSFLFGSAGVFLKKKS